MKKLGLLLLCCGLVAVFSVGQTECPNWPKPPFDTTGLYKGTWSGQTTEPAPKQQAVEDCPLTIHLQQNVNAAYPGDHGVKGTVEIDYSCVEWPDWVTQTPPASTVQVGGLLADDGTLTLLSGACGTGICLVLALSGQGADTDGDGLMDTYSGAWSFTILLAGVQPFGVTGTFETERWLER